MRGEPAETAPDGNLADGGAEAASRDWGGETDAAAAVRRSDGDTEELCDRAAHEALWINNFDIVE